MTRQQRENNFPHQTNLYSNRRDWKRRCFVTFQPTNLRQLFLMGKSLIIFLQPFGPSLCV